MKNIVNGTRRIINALKVTDNEPSAFSIPDIKKINKPDAEIQISETVINTLLNQNFPLQTDMALENNKQVHISVKSARVQIRNTVARIDITDARIAFEKTRFQIGLTSNRVSLDLTIGIRKDKNRFNLVVAGAFSRFDINYLPAWLEKKIVDYLKKRILSPILDQDITPIVTLRQEIDSDYGVFHFQLEPEELMVRIDTKKIVLSVKYKNPQNENQTPASPEESTC